MYHTRIVVLGGRKTPGILPLVSANVGAPPYAQKFTDAKALVTEFDRAYLVKRTRKQMLSVERPTKAAKKSGRV